MKTTTTTASSPMLTLTMKLVLLSSGAVKSAQSFQLIIPSHVPMMHQVVSYHSHPRTTSLVIMPMGTQNGHDYERDISSDQSNVDVDAVNDLLGERLRARKRGDFGVADQIRDQLSADHKVTVFDQDRMWVTGEGATNKGGRISSSSGRGGRGSGRGGDNRAGGRGLVGRGRGGRGGRGGPMQRRDFSSSFGPNGHDYNAVAGSAISSDMAEPAIHSKVAERLMAKMNRDFDTADRIQLELAEEGVYVNDRTKEWRADGVRFIDPSEGRRAPTDRNRPYVQSRHSQSLKENAKFTLERIGELVAERNQHKQNKIFSKADSIRDALEKACDVVIDDRVREWSIGGSFGKEADLKRAHSEVLKSRSYVKSPASLDLPDGVTQNDVQARVDARTKARANHQYEESDSLRDGILQEFNVVIHDTIKMWSVGGDFGEDDPVRARAAQAGKYTRRGGGNLSEDDVVLIQDMLTKRFEAKRARDFNRSDEIRSHLHTTFNINVDDKSQEWRVLSDDYVQTTAERGAQELTADEASVVDSQLAKRIILKKNKSYEEADAIRDELQSTWSILVDDKKKEWKVIASSGGKSRFNPEVARSQPSPNEQKQIEREVDDWFEVEDEVELDVAADTTVVADAEPEEENTSSPSTMSRDELTILTVPLLKDKLREAGKPVSGKKSDLIDRLLA
mmetsp:Transcript_3003/g.6544  ORF Transcript_3003/g.6544 Transcript_3003/m.6544 type:complete len:678 (+) Transcript_3003:88-2121(+)